MDRDFLTDLFSEFGPVDIKRMFSGFGVSADGVNFALSLRAGLFLRADADTIPRFEAEGCGPFTYQTRQKTVTVNSYWQMPARLFDDPTEAAEWARAALDAARRAAVKKRPRAKKSAVAAKAEPKTPAKRKAARRTKTAATKPVARSVKKTRAHKAKRGGKR